MPYTLHRTPALDGLRGLAILCVLLSHAGLPLFGGHLLMFVLSGFLITSLLLREADTTGTLHLRAFYARRAWRLLPALVVMLAGVNLAVALTAPDALPELQRDTVYALLSLSNWAHLWHTPSPLLIHLWSLALQEQVLVVWPVVMILVRVSRRVLLILCVLIVVSVWALRTALLVSGVPLSVLYVSTVTRVDAVFVGCALAIVLALPHARGWSAWSQRYPVLTSALGMAVVGIIAVCMRFYPMREPLTYVVSLPLVSLCTAALIALCILPQTSMLKRLLECRLLTSLGAVSYGVYLWHWPLIVLLHGLTPHARLIGAVAGLVMGALSYWVIERPVLRRAERKKRLV